ncbi:hypothetical protein BDV19DRAFT_20351 [Aspergillus venezuelensis]
MCQVRALSQIIQVVNLDLDLDSIISGTICVMLQVPFPRKPIGRSIPQRPWLFALRRPVSCLLPNNALITTFVSHVHFWSSDTTSYYGPALRGLGLSASLPHARSGRAHAASLSRCSRGRDFLPICGEALLLRRVFTSTQYADHLHGRNHGAALFFCGDLRLMRGSLFSCLLWLLTAWVSV